MKCSNCGHELEPGSGFCENCGMIISLDAEPDVPDTGKEEQTSRDVYSGSPQVQEEEEAVTDSPVPEAESDWPRELEADATEQIVPVVEYPEKDEEQTAEEPTDGSDIYVADSRIETSEFEDEEEPSEDEDGIADDSDRDTVSEEDGAREYESDFDGEDEEEPQEEDQDEEDEEDDDEEDDDLDDMYVASSKSKRNSVIIAVLLVILVAVTAGAITMIKNHIGRVPVDVPVTEAQSTTVQKESATTKPVKDAESETKDETTGETEDETTLPETTEEATTQKETEKETEKETTKKAEQAVTEPSKQTTKKPSVSESATKRETTKPSTTKSTTTKPTTTKPTTTKPTTTKPTTTKPTTTKPTTTKPTTTKPTTTKPSTTTDPYGFGTDEVQKPAVYLNTKDRYTVYVAVKSLTVRNKPSQSSSRVVYVSLGEALTVYGKSQDGFVYIRSNRYGVYGWVAEKYISKSRPVTDSVVVVPGIVEPDKQFASPKMMYVKADIGIRLRKAPDKDAASVRSLSYGFPVKVTGYSSENSGWVYVTDVTHGVTGWTRLEWLADKV